MRWENIPLFIRKHVTDSWVKEKVLKLYLRSPRKVQYLLARYGIRIAMKKKRARMLEFMRH